MLDAVTLKAFSIFTANIMITKGLPKASKIQLHEIPYQKVVTSVPMWRYLISFSFSHIVHNSYKLTQ